MAAEHRINIKFVQEVEKYPYLYNHRLPEYVRKDITEQAWANIGKKFKLSGSECKEKWKNLRCVFVRHLKPPKVGTTSIKKPYYLNEFMQFALPFVKLNCNNYSQETLHNDQLLPSSKLPDEEAGDQTEEFISTSPPRLSPLDQNSFENLTNKYVPNKKTKSKDVEQAIASYLKVKQSKIIERCNSEENSNCGSNKMFLLSVLPDMNKMSEKKRRAFKRRLLDLVDEIIDEDSD